MWWCFCCSFCLLLFCFVLFCFCFFMWVMSSKKRHSKNLKLNWVHWLRFGTARKVEAQHSVLDSVAIFHFRSCTCTKPDTVLKIPGRLLRSSLQTVLCWMRAFLWPGSLKWPLFASSAWGWPTASTLQLKCTHDFGLTILTQLTHQCKPICSLLHTQLVSYQAFPALRLSRSEGPGKRKQGWISSLVTHFNLCVPFCEYSYPPPASHIQ